MSLRSGKLPFGGSEDEFLNHKGDRPTTITNLGYVYFEKRRLLLVSERNWDRLLPMPFAGILVKILHRELIS